MKQYLQTAHPFKIVQNWVKREPFFEPTSQLKHGTCWKDGTSLKWFSPDNKEFVVLTISGVDAEAVKDLLQFLALKSKLKTEQCQTNTLTEIHEAVCEISRQQQYENIKNERYEDKVTEHEKKSFLATVNAKIEENLCNEQFRVSDLARLLCCCEMQLYRKIKQFSELSPVNYIRRYRLRRGLQNLQQTSLPITQICYKVGFTSLEYFSRSFKKEFGICPSAVRAGQNVGFVQANV